ncbi:MAG: TIGR02996 domain-containing protein [Gemmataceae bacterium]
MDKIFGSPEVEEIYLFYADWLEEQGESDRAKLIRVEIQLGQTRWYNSHLGGFIPGQQNKISDELGAETYRLKNAWEKKWPLSKSLKNKLDVG